MSIKQLCNQRSSEGLRFCCGFPGAKTFQDLWETGSWTLLDIFWTLASMIYSAMAGHGNYLNNQYQSCLFSTRPRHVMARFPSFGLLLYISPEMAFFIAEFLAAGLPWTSVIKAGHKKEESKAISINISMSFVNKRISGDTRGVTWWNNNLPLGCNQFYLSSSFLAGEQNFAFCWQRNDQKQKERYIYI